MFKINYLTVLLVTYLLSKSEASIAPFIKSCKSNDLECLKISTQIAIPIVTAGISSLGVSALDPMVLKEVNADQGDLKLTFTDLKLAGLSKCNAISVTRDVNKGTISVVLECPIVGTGKYKLDGKVLFIPAEGEGDFNLKTENIQIKATLKTKTIKGADGNEHWKLTGYDYSFDLVKKVFFNFDNLFGGDATRAKPILDLLDHSWKDLITEIGAPIIDQIVKRASEEIKKFFLAVPLTDLEIV